MHNGDNRYLCNKYINQSLKIDFVDFWDEMGKM